jgi:hypothetical protein
MARDVLDAERRKPPRRGAAHWHGPLRRRDEQQRRGRYLLQVTRRLDEIIEHEQRRSGRLERTRQRPRRASASRPDA